MMIATQPSQFVKTSIPVVDNVSSVHYNHSNWGSVFLKAYDGQTRTAGIVNGYYNDDYVIHDGYGGEANNTDTKYSTNGQLGLAQSYMTMHSFSLSAANAAADYVMTAHQVYSINRVRDVPDGGPFYLYPNFRFTKIADDSKYNSVDFKSSLIAWIKNRTGTPRPLACSVRLFISWCMWGSRKKIPQIGRITSEPDGFITAGGPDGGSFEGEYFKKADSYTDANGNNFGPVYQMFNISGVQVDDPTILFNMAINKWQVGSFTNLEVGGLVWGLDTWETNSNKYQTSSIMPAYRWTFTAVQQPNTNYFIPSRQHGAYYCAGPVHVSGGLGLGYLHSLYVYV